MLFNNPIGLVDDNKVQEFNALSDFYLKVLQMLLQQFPKGHIDYMVFLYDNTMLRGTPLGECCRAIERNWEESENFCIKVSWSSLVQTRETLTILFRKILKHTTNSFFDLRQFDMAWRKFQQSIKNE